MLGTIGGIIAGAVGANALEHRHEKFVSPQIYKKPCSVEQENNAKF